MIKNSVNFWNKRAKVIKVAGSNDPYLNIYETKKLITLLKSKKKILDVGCGTGNLLDDINEVKKISFGVGIDFSSKMIERAKKINIKNKNLKFYNIDMNNYDELKNITKQKFDYIITKRSIINVLSRKKQMNIIDNLGKLLKRSGKLLACECSRNDQQNLNKIRKQFNLKSINPPWHNLYFNDDQLKKFKFKNVKLTFMHDFTSTYYFVSRIINAIEKQKKKKIPKYNDLLNIIGWNLNENLIKGFSQTKIYEFRPKN